MVPDVERITLAHRSPSLHTRLQWRSGSFWLRMIVSANLKPQVQNMLTSKMSPK